MNFMAIKKKKIVLKKTKKTSKIKVKLPAKVIEYLKKAGVNHNLLDHRTVYTAYDAAATMGKKLSEIAKSLLIKADRDYYLAILPADQNLDFEKIKKHIGKITDKEVKVVKIPGEKIMQETFKLKNDALSAFGTLHKLPVIMDQQLAKAKKAIFSSGSFNHSVEMGVKDFVKLENAVLGKFGVKKKIQITKTKTKIVKKAKAKKKK